jgi:dipeptidyl aminopeptidase/acylaminoacyl peptidase
MTDPNLIEIREQLRELLDWKNELNHTVNTVLKKIDDLNWHNKVSQIADWEKIRITGPPPSEYALKVIRKIEAKNNPAYAHSRQPEDKIVIYAYTFKPKKIEANQKYPLIVLPHGGIHGNFNSEFAKVVSELVVQGYIIVAPDYRGSDGYGQIYWNLVDYGPSTISDIFTSRNWMIENYKQIDRKRIGIMGWSMGGYHTLMQIFNYPSEYAAAFAGVPVSDLLIRLSYRPWDALSRAEIYSGGKIGDQHELRKRSPTWNAEKLEIPLLIHAATNDRDVYITEIDNLIAHLKSAGKKFEYKIYQDPPGGHGFETLDTYIAQEARLEIYKFIAKYLKPMNPPKS